MTASLTKNEDGYLRLCREQIYLAINDLHDKANRQSSLAFFLSENFRVCCKICGYDYKTIIEDVYEMSKLNDLQRKVRGQQIIKRLKAGSANNVCNIGRGGRKTH